MHMHITHRLHEKGRAILIDLEEDVVGALRHGCVAQLLDAGVGAVWILHVLNAYILKDVCVERGVSE